MGTVIKIMPATMIMIMISSSAMISAARTTITSDDFIILVARVPVGAGRIF